MQVDIDHSVEQPSNPILKEKLLSLPSSPSTSWLRVGSCQLCPIHAGMWSSLVLLRWHWGNQLLGPHGCKQPCHGQRSAFPSTLCPPALTFFFSSSGMFPWCWWGKGFNRYMVWAPIVTYFQHFNQFWISALTDANWKSGEQLVLWEKSQVFRRQFGNMTI